MSSTRRTARRRTALLVLVTTLGVGAIVPFLDSGTAASGASIEAPSDGGGTLPGGHDHGICIAFHANGALPGGSAATGPFIRPVYAFRSTGTSLDPVASPHLSPSRSRAPPSI